MKRSSIKSILLLVFCCLFSASSFGLYAFTLHEEVEEEAPVLPEPAYVADDEYESVYYVLEPNDSEDEEEISLKEAGRLVRGSRIDYYEEDVLTVAEEKTYYRIEDPFREPEPADTGEDKDEDEDENEEEEEAEPEYYISSENLSLSATDVVKESEIYVRNSSTIYKESSGPAIASFAAKGSCLKVCGYENLREDGSVEKYKVVYGETEAEEGSQEEPAELSGYIMSRYTVRSQEEADKVYNENGIHDAAKKDNYDMELYGGKAANLDYYPRERITIEGNSFCADARAMYINGVAAVKPDNYVKLINSTDCNAVVIDIKDGYLAYQSDVAKEYSPRSYKSAYASKEDYKKGVDAYRETGAYLIGRIVVFNDAIYAKDHPEDCIEYGDDTGWPSAFSRSVWEYNIRLAIEAVREFGFNEIQFDYVRFPESAYEMSLSKKTDFKNLYGEEKGQAVQNFCIYAADMLHEEGAYMSVDVFGESAYGYMTAYGQYWPGISNVVDAISAMPYTDHMGVENSWEDPYGTMLSWSKKAKKQQDKLKNPAAARTWITGYDTPHWDPVVDYNGKMLSAQVKALNKAGLEGGFIPWNAASDLGKYTEYKSVWGKK